MATRRCCCGSGCVGCCLPYVDNDESCSPPGRRVKILAWTLSAPNCPEIDGLTGQFSPETTCPHTATGPCGNCMCMVNTGHADTFVLGQAYYVEESNDSLCDPPGSPLPCCALTSCGAVGFCFNLMCNAFEPLQSGELIDNCCGRLKLIVLVRGPDQITGGDPVVLANNECLDSINPEDPNFAGCDGTGGVFLQLDPVECYCEDDEPLQEFEVVYDLSVIVFGCVGEADPPCVDKPSCCMPFNCTLAGATITVVVGE